MKYRAEFTVRMPSFPVSTFTLSVIHCDLLFIIGRYAMRQPTPKWRVD